MVAGHEAMSEVLGPALPSDSELFSTAAPFPHLVVDGFFSTAFCEALDRDFPSTERAVLFTEYGRRIGKATVEDVRSLGQTYERFDDLLRSADFLALLERMTGIPDLVFDPACVGGGTHENLDGQALHPHIDFNHHPKQGWYRRLNLLVYLNRGWQDEWGGNITLSADPEDRQAQRVTVSPEWNRAVLFETSERSWHGFDRLRLAQAPPGTTRRSLSAYYYTRNAPADAGPEHSTVYVPPGPQEARDEAERIALGEEKDALLRHLRSENLRLSGDVARLQRDVQEARGALRVPLLGYLRQEGSASGLHVDGWTGASFSCALAPLSDVVGLVVRGYRPGAQQQSVSVRVDGQEVASGELRDGGPFELQVPCRRGAGTLVDVTVQASPPWRSDNDGRDLGFVLLSIDALHVP